MTLPQDLYHHTPAIFLAHGYVGEVLGKTVHGVLMHSTVFDVVALIDKDKAGLDTSQICPGVTKRVPIYTHVSATFVHQPKVLILTESPSEKTMDEIKICIRNGMDVINPGFVFLTGFSELVAMAAESNATLMDLRDVKRIWKMPDGSILNIKAKVVYVAGTDCGLGKRTAAFELAEAAKNRGIRAAFVATGQTGLLLGCDGGIVMDAIIINYVAGAIEELIVDVDKKGFDLIFLEGQAALMHYGCSAVISLIHAGNPHAIVLVHDPSREYHAEFGTSPIFKMCDLQREIDVIESLYLPGGNKFKVVAVPTRGPANINAIKALTALPVADVRKPGGPDIILDAVLEHLQHTYRWQPNCTESNTMV